MLVPYCPTESEALLQTATDPTAAQTLVSGGGVMAKWTAPN
jgi:hypothetical protein